VRATNDVITGPGIQVPLAGQSTTSAETHYDKGWAVQKSVFGKMIDELYEQSPKDQLHIERFLSANCCGDFYTPGSRHQNQETRHPFNPPRDGRIRCAGERAHGGQRQYWQRLRELLDVIT
jgi:hypothetical protein